MDNARDLWPRMPNSGTNNRIWWPKHHNDGRIASAGNNPFVIVPHCGQDQEKIRVGAVASMLPNHAPDRDCGTVWQALERLFPGRYRIWPARAPVLTRLPFAR